MLQVKFREFSQGLSSQKALRGKVRARFAYLLAVVSSVSATHKVLIGPAVQVGVFSAEDAVASKANLTLALVHGVAEVAEVDALCVPVAAVGSVQAGVLWFTYLRTPDI